MKSVCLILMAAYAAGCSAGQKVEFVQDANRIDVTAGGKPVTSYRYGRELTKPVLWPVQAPSGVTVTRSFPLGKDVAGESTDHPHHIGVFFTYDEVNGEGFWNNTTSPPQVKHVKVTKMHEGDGKGTLSTVSHWVGKDGKTLLEEKRDMVFWAGDDEYVIDFDIDLTAQEEKAVFGDTKEGMFAIRVAHWLQETGKGATGEYLSSNGDKKEKEVWGKRARWVRLEGQKDGKTVGIAIINRPDSVNYPTFWHARGYGLFAANPLGQYAFEEGRKVENPQKFNLTLEPGQSAHFAFRMVIYDGARTREQIEECANVEK
jgi:hypothetical protein